MPIYEYRCTKCEKVTEALQKMGARALRKCPHCGGRMEKMVSRTGFQLKGGGWFSEGYGSGGKATAAGGKGGKAGPDKASSESSTKKDTKKRASAG